LARGDDIEERLVAFAVGVIRVSEVLPDTQAGQHVRGQLLRSGTSPAANYSEARNAESSRDFIHKLKIVIKELNETQIWLKIIIQSEMVTSDRLDSLLDECVQLRKIIGASLKTARSKRENS
jgi:four helix bundle protein